VQNDQRAVIGAEVAHRQTMCSLLQIQHCALLETSRWFSVLVIVPVRYCSV